MKLWLLLLLIAASSAFAEDLDKDLHELQEQAQSLLSGLQKSGQAGSLPGAEHLDVARRKVYALATDKKFLQAVNDLWSSPKRSELLIAQGVFFVVIFLLRAWRQAKTQNWFKKILVGLFFTLILWGGMFYVIPVVVLGEPYQVLVSTLWHVLVSA